MLLSLCALLALMGAAKGELPLAHLDKIDPQIANEGDPISLEGHGSGGEGNITAYRWRSSLEGNFGSTANLSYAGLGPGNHTIFFSVQDESGNWSAEVTEYLDLNALPVATIDATTPRLVNADEPFTLLGNGSDADGTILEVLWFSDTWGTLGTSLTAQVQGLTAGSYAIGLWVKDDQLARSPIAYINITVNAHPVITHFSLDDQVIPYGQSMNFELKGQDTEDTELGYLLKFVDEGNELTRFISGNRQDDISFDTNRIPSANYTLSVYLTDSLGGTSQPRTTWVYLNAPPQVNFTKFIRLPNPQLVVYQLLANVTDEGDELTYEWNSSVLGPLGTSSEPNFVWEFPSVGIHALTVRARDEWGVWSETSQLSAPLIIEAPVEPEPDDTEEGFLGLEGGTGVFLVILLFFLMVLTVGTWQGGRYLMRKDVIQPRSRMAEQVERHQSLGLAYPSERYQQLIEQEPQLTKLLTLRKETQNMEDLLDERLKLYDEVSRLMTMARGWATKADAAGIQYDFGSWEQAQVSFREGELERARDQAKKAATVIKESLGEAEADGLDMEHVSGEAFDQWSKPELSSDGPAAAEATASSKTKQEGSTEDRPAKDKPILEPVPSASSTESQEVFEDEKKDLEGPVKPKLAGVAPPPDEMPVTKVAEITKVQEQAPEEVEPASVQEVETAPAVLEETSPKVVRPGEIRDGEEPQPLEMVEQPLRTEVKEITDAKDSASEKPHAVKEPIAKPKRPILEPAPPQPEADPEMELVAPEYVEKPLEFAEEDTWTERRERKGGRPLDDEKRQEIEETVSQRAVPIPVKPVKAKKRRTLGKGLAKGKLKRKKAVEPEQTVLEVEPQLETVGTSVIVEPVVEVTGEPALSPEEEWRRAREEARQQAKAQKVEEDEKLESLETPSEADIDSEEPVQQTTDEISHDTSLEDSDTSEKPSTRESIADDPDESAPWDTADEGKDGTETELPETFELDVDGSVTCMACGTVADLEQGYDEQAQEFTCPGCGSLGDLAVS